MKAPPCEREGCPRPRRRTTTGNLMHCCSGICNITRVELEALQSLIQAAGPSPEASSAWTALVEISDSLTRYHQLKTRVYRSIRHKDNDDQT